MRGFRGFGYAWTALLCALSFAHCGGGMSQMLTSAYFPINVGDVRNLQRTKADGSQANFAQTIDAETNLNGVQVFPFTTKDAQGNVVRVDYYGADTSQGVLICGFDDNENNTTSRYNPCIFLPALMTGQSHSSTVSVVGTGLLANAVSLDYTFTVENFGTATEPAGTFNDCFMNSIQTTNKDANGASVESGTFTVTLCPNVGGVRLAHTGLTFGSATSDLLSAVIGGKSYP